MKVLIVDDEPIARQVLREYLEDFSGVEIAGEAGTGREAVALVERVTPDVVLLDLHMPEMDGFSVAEVVRGKNVPVIIYVTAFQEHALRAFETGAVDYLLKPVRAERLAEALERARTRLAGLASESRKIVGRLGDQVRLFEPGEVVAFQADGEVVFILTAQGRFFANGSLRSLEERLAGGPFRRVHRKTLINRDHIRMVSPLSSKRWLLRMSNGLEVVVSKRLAGLVREETKG
jgi:DNA-binding LytR/AlgR family response regulator